jgi:ribose transport system permease protein
MKHSSSAYIIDYCCPNIQYLYTYLAIYLTGDRKIGIPPFVATLSMLAIARGLTLVYTEGRPIAGLDERFIFWGTGQVWGIPLPVILMAVIAVVAHIVTRYTPFGLHVYSTGGNEETTRLTGISPDCIKLAVYMISGFLAALGGVLLAARL